MLLTNAGTARWHSGRQAHPATLADLGTPGVAMSHAARTIAPTDSCDLGLVLAIDLTNPVHLRAGADRRRPVLGDLERLVAALGPAADWIRTAHARLAMGPRPPEALAP